MREQENLANDGRAGFQDNDVILKVTGTTICGSEYVTAQLLCYVRLIICAVCICTSTEFQLKSPQKSV